MLRNPREDHPSPMDADATAARTAHSLDGTSLNGGPAGSRTATVEQDAWLSAALEALPRAIRMLPHPEQRLVVGRFYEQRPIGELARELHLTPARATALLGEAVRTLRRKVGG